MQKKNKIILLLLILLLVTLTACRAPEETPNQPETPPELAPEMPQAEEKVDGDLTEQLLEEEAIINGQVYEQGEYMIATMIIEEGVTQKEIDRITLAYAETLKEKYPDKSINVQAVQGHNNVANILIE